VERAAQPGAAADLAFGLVFSIVCSSRIRNILESSPAQSAKQLSAVRWAEEEYIDYKEEI
jgi:hypothetical protein